MENDYKIGRAIKDKEINFIKKYFKENTIEVNGRANGRYDRHDMLKSSVIKVKSIRKYENRYYNNRFAYEVDIELDIKNSPCVLNYPAYYVKYQTTKRTRSLNDYYRYEIKEIIMDELKYFGFSQNDTVISKIKYISE